MIPKGDIPGVCEDCGKRITYSKKPMQTHTELLKKHWCSKCGNFALKTLSTDL